MFEKLLAYYRDTKDQSYFVEATNQGLVWLDEANLRDKIEAEVNAMSNVELLELWDALR